MNIQIEQWIYKEIQKTVLTIVSIATVAITICMSIMYKIHEWIDG